MERSGGAIVLRPHAVEFGGGSDQHGLHHAVGVSVVRIEAVEPVERPHAQRENGPRDRISTPSGKNMHG